MFQKYKASYVNNIYHWDIVEEWKANMEKSDYDHKLDKGESLPYENRSFYISIKDHWKKQILD